MTKCAYELCNRPVEVMVSGLCRSHYKQQWRGEELKPIKPRMHKDDKGRVCTTCERYKSWDQYYERANGNGYHQECRSCLSQRSRRNYLKRKEKEAAV